MNKGGHLIGSIVGFFYGYYYYLACEFAEVSIQTLL